MTFFLKSRLRAAIERSDILSLETLLEGRKNLELDLEIGATPLQYAVMKKREDVVDYLIKAGAKVDAPDVWGWTPLHRAAYLGQLGIAVRLLQAGADPNLRTSDGKNAQGMASLRGETEVRDVLQPYIKKVAEVFDLPPPPVKEKPQEPAMPGGGWTLLGEAQVARTLSNAALGYKLTDVFDFRARERIRIVNNTETRRDQVETCSFDTIPDKALLEDALKALSAMGGKADAGAIHGGLQKTAKLPPPQPS